jgi:hypothetical protein
MTTKVAVVVAKIADDQLHLGGDDQFALAHLLDLVEVPGWLQGCVGVDQGRLNTHAPILQAVS